MAYGKKTAPDRKAARAVAETAAMNEVRREADLQRMKTEKLRQLRLEREALAPPKKKPAPRKPPGSDLNLAQTQKIAKK